MSLSFSTTDLSNASLNTSLDALPTTKAAAAKQTTTQQIDDLASSGQSAALIASSLSVPVTQVDAALGITSSATSQASAVVALSGRLSIHA